MRTCMSIIVAVLLCTFSGCSQVNTRIGWPWTYWQHGFWPLVGFLVVCGLVFLAFCMLSLAAAEDQPDQCVVIVGGVVLLLAGLLLQALPHSTNGIQFVPVLPWHYASWIATIISGVGWLALILGYINVFNSVKENWSEAAFFLLVAIGLNALLSFATPVGVNLPDQPAPQIEPGQNQIAQWERRKEDRAQALARLLADRESLVCRIRSLGAKSKQEFMAQEIGRTLMDEFEQLARQIATVQQEVETIETMTEKTKSRLRSLEREALLRGTKVTEEEYQKMSGTDHALEEELRRRIGEKMPGSEVQTEKLLDELFTRER
jgi:hypothetical protein